MRHKHTMKRLNITRKELAKVINQKLGVSQRSASQLIDEVFDNLKSALLSEESVKLVQFGTFSIKRKSSRVGRNPRTGDTMEICPRCMVSFRPSKTVREQINS